MIHDWIRLASTWPVVRRALKYAIVVGAVLIAINHGDAIMRGDLDTVRFVKMGLTILVAYVVSALSSVGAMLDLQARDRLGGGKEHRSEEGSSLRVPAAVWRPSRV